MIEIRIHGRGGQGAVVASLILARSAHLEGWYVQVFPEFGVERRGVPVTAFARLDKQPIYVRTKVYNPDHVVVLDPALIHFVDVCAGMHPGGWIVINSAKPPSAFPFADRFNVATADATAIAAKYKIGTPTAPIVNTSIVGAFAQATKLISLKSLADAITKVISGPAAEANITAAREAYENTTRSMGLLQEAFARMEEAFELEES